MNLPPKEYTKQENIIADCLDEFGMRYSQQTSFPPYTVDFYVSEIQRVIEADGIYGHNIKRDRKRDKDLKEYPEIEDIIHITAITKKDIKEQLWQALNKLSQ
jgi:very-short-patch-repair endonuclease|tara:strand:- start:306 stop:611 length:306 start_codon:yes stop_codon:yes gene_type:complete